MLLLVSNGIPPDVEQPLAELGSLDEEATKVEATTILGNDDVDALGLVVSDRRLRNLIDVEELVLRRGVGDVQWIIDVDVAVGDVLEMVEDVRLEGDRRLHDERVQIHPPKPAVPFPPFSHRTPPSARSGAYHSALGYCRIVCLMTSTFSQLSRHSWA